MKNLKKVTKGISVALAALGLSTAVNAFTITGNSVNNVNWSYAAGGALSTNLSATGTFTVSNFSSTGFDLLIALTNTTSSSFQSGLMSLGMFLSPDLTGSFLDDGTKYDSLTNASGNFPGGYDFNFCVYASNNCQGGNINNGLASGASDSFLLHFAGANITSVSFDPLSVKWQTQDGSYECAAGQNCGSTSVPEPGSLALLAAGMLGLVFSRRYVASH